MSFPSNTDRIIHRPAKQLKAKTIPDRSRSPIAADGGFGDPPSSDEEGDENETDLPPKPLPTAINTEPEVGGQGTEDDGFGDDFDDFAEGEEADDFGDFDEGLEPPEEPVQEPKTTRRPSIAPVELPFVSLMQCAAPTVCLHVIANSQLLIEPFIIRDTGNAIATSQYVIPGRRTCSRC